MQQKRLFSFPLLCLLLLIAACGTPAGASNNKPSIQSPTSAPAQQRDPLARTCPAPGTGRPAAMPALHLGTHQQIIYYHNIDNQVVLDRYNVQTHSTSVITGQIGEHIQTTQVSGDGQWVLFVAQVNTISEIQIVRIDGQFLQTLYCAPDGQQIDPTHTTGVQWSPDQKQLIFNQGDSPTVPAPLYLLNLVSGQVQVELSIDDPKGPSFQPRTWLDNKRVYISDFFPQPASLFILDTGKGANQHEGNLRLVIGVGDTPWSFDSSYDASKLFVTFYDPTVGRAGPGTYCKIYSYGDNSKLILDSNKLVVSDVRVVGYGSTSLLLQVNEKSGSAAQYDGFWKINANGSGLVRLTNGPATFNQFTQYPWSNFSRDGSLYTDGLFYGSLKGGPLTRYASDGEGEGNVLVGWTTF